MKTLEVLVVTGLFFLRIGIPVMLLFAVGAVIERAYARRAVTQEEQRKQAVGPGEAGLSARPYLREQVEVEPAPVEAPREAVR